MSTIYTPAPPEVVELANTFIEKYHPDLVTVEAKIDYIFAHPEIDDKTGEPKGPALKLHGYQALAIAKIISHKDRVMGRGDCEVTIDAKWWQDAPLPKRTAVLDHELTHFEVKRDKYGVFEADDGGRPKLKMRLHDRQYGWFDSIAERHGLDSVEIQQFRELYDNASQTYFAFDTLSHAMMAQEKIISDRFSIGSDE